jgi:hypothetical protein
VLAEADNAKPPITNAASGAVNSLVKLYFILIICGIHHGHHHSLDGAYHALLQKVM